MSVPRPPDDTVEDVTPEFDDALIAQGEVLLQQGIASGAGDPNPALYATACFVDSIARSLNAIQSWLEQIPIAQPKDDVSQPDWSTDGI